MKKFNSLVRKEHHDFKAWHLSLLFITLMLIYMLPSLIKHFTEINAPVQETRLLMVFISLVLLFTSTLMQLIASTRIAIKQKMIWLHNTQSIYVLLSAKIIYAMLVMIVATPVICIGFFFVGDIVQATFLQMILFMLFNAFAMVCAFFMIASLFYFFYAMSLQMRRYIGRATTIVTFIILVLLLNTLDDLSLQLLQFGPVWSFDWLLRHFPVIESAYFSFAIYSDFYIIEEIGLWCLVIACFIIGGKWIERVITR